MLKQKTVLILGAGASKDYGFPLGYQLRDKIVSLTRQLPRHGGHATGEHFRSYLASVGINNQESISEFSRHFDGSMLSIDAFLAQCELTPNRKEYIEIGKRAIAWIIAEHENTKLLIPRGDGKEDWYAHLWNQVYLNFKNNTIELLKIITFNYDRSLEIYLLSRIKDTFGLSDPQAIEHLKRVEIIHVYGQLGDWNNENSEVFRGYSFLPSDDFAHVGEIERSAKMIRVIGERSQNDAAKRIREILKETDRICFLGFGYDEQNLAVLGFDDEWREYVLYTKRVFICGSTHGKTMAEVKQAVKLLTPDLLSQSDFHRTHFVDASCLSTLRETGVLSSDSL